jgi:hypothetical protein
VLTEILAHGGKILECATKVATLEEIFCSLLQPGSKSAAGDADQTSVPADRSADLAEAEVTH